MKYFVLLIILLFTGIVLKAQQTAMDYIYCSDGFEVKKTIKEKTIYNTNGSIEIRKLESVGLYSKDGKTLVAAMKCPDSEFYVIDGCETICSGAFQAFQNTTVFIPSTIINIAPDAVKAHNAYSNANKFGGIVDGMKEEIPQSAISSSSMIDNNATEVARYNLQGVSINQPVNGVNIIQMSDGTSAKQLVR